MEYDTFRSLLAEGFHTAFRKAAESHNAHVIWTMISELPDGEYRRVVSFVAEPVWDYLQQDAPADLVPRLRALADRWDPSRYTGEPTEREQCARELRAELPAAADHV